MELGHKIYRAIQKGLNEALSNLSIDDFDDVEMPSAEPSYDDINKTCANDDAILAWKSKKLLIAKFVNKQRIAITKEEEIELRQFINSHPDTNVGIINANDKDHLKKLVESGIKFLGNDANLNWINTSNITDMSDLFEYGYFNGDISNWDVSNVKTMFGMFVCSDFNKDISKWDVSSVINMSWMFNESQFNGNLSRWDVSNVQDMSYMFCESRFNGDISKWDVSNVQDMRYMFEKSQFNGDISNWNVFNVKKMNYMFARSQFNGDISKWDVSHVTEMIHMFARSQFNGDISKWDVSHVQDMRDMFADCPTKEEYKPKFN